jgi:hypothetical protein
MTTYLYTSRQWDVVQADAAAAATTAAAWGGGPALHDRFWGIRSSDQFVGKSLQKVFYYPLVVWNSMQAVMTCHELHAYDIMRRFVTPMIKPASATPDTTIRF